ncbi:acetyl-CoA carboxylase biotin carboxylase subunit family protein [Nocardiopsis alba]|uniref:ATP-grasp domain-containing protein n=1 Tax=Nocardiopsis alba TaxID=53437 RepID=UPI00366CD61A
MRNVFVMGMDERDHDLWRRTPTGRDCRFHRLPGIEGSQVGGIDVERTLDAARRVLDDFDGPVDAIIGHRDLPGTLLVPILCAERGLPGPDPEAVVRCEHRYWSRLLQAEVTDAHPPFAPVDLDLDEPRPDLEYPLWMRPIDPASPEPAFRVEDARGLARAVERLRRGTRRFSRLFESVVERVEPPAEVAAVGRHHCLAEGAPHGVRIAVEGYVHRGRATVYAVLDSVDFPGTPVFLRHQYPSAMPGEIRRRLADIAERVVEHHGLDSTTFVVEFSYDPIEDRIGIVEIDPRPFQSHTALFELVDGVADHERVLRLALGEDPDLSDVGEKGYPVAAEWYHRRFRDGVVARVPTTGEVRALERTLPGVRIRIVPETGRRLSDMFAQEAHGYELARIVTGGEDELDMQAKYEYCVKALRFEFEDGTARGNRLPRPLPLRFSRPHAFTRRRTGGIAP